MLHHLLNLLGLPPEHHLAAARAVVLGGFALAFLACITVACLDWRAERRRDHA